ncbi:MULTISPECIES: hypothetical protein [unclassified Leucobacter]|uniref:hypothetical protein n=1 Tax=unclassified Leucobacter TaxID=2621730 RepID=UPI00165DF590|nr:MULTISPECIES: hypothetical protein [unclassified Leucobacter]MBC9936358.1 hypothetical protein [Leucobacter sp. cx-87]
MALRRALAGIAATTLALGGIALTTTTAHALPAGGVVLASDIVVTTDPASETTYYNEWHYSPSASYPGRATQGGSGLVFAAADRSIAVVGNGNNNVAGGTAPAMSLEDTLNGVNVNAGLDASRVFYQVPVFYAYDSGTTTWKFTTLRKNAATGGDWISSQAIGGTVAANTPTPMATLLAALGEDPSETPVGSDPRAIATGFLIEAGAAGVQVNSFTGNGSTTQFAPAIPSCVPNAASATFVDAANIRPNEAAYPGWHNGLTKTETVKNFVTTEAGLAVTGNAQILNGLADPAEFQANCLSAAADMKVDVVHATGPVATQVPVFYYPSGNRAGAESFTTIRLDNAMDLGDPNALWSTSSPIWADDAKTIKLADANSLFTLDQFVAAVGVHDVIGFGFYVNIDQNATVSSVTFNNQTTNFAKPVVQPTKPVKVETGVAAA